MGPCSYFVNALSFLISLSLSLIFRECFSSLFTPRSLFSLRLRFCLSCFHQTFSDVSDPGSAAIHRTWIRFRDAWSNYPTLRRPPAHHPEQSLAPQAVCSLTLLTSCWQGSVQGDAGCSVVCDTKKLDRPTCASPGHPSHVAGASFPGTPRGFQ